MQGVTSKVDSVTLPAVAVTDTLIYYHVSITLGAIWRRIRDIKTDTTESRQKRRPEGRDRFTFWAVASKQIPKQIKNRDCTTVSFYLSASNDKNMSVL